MKNYKILIACIAVFAMLFTSCSKDENPMQDGNTEKATLSFGASLNDLLNKQPATKSHFSDVPECSDAEPATVKVVGSQAGAGGTSTFTLDVLSDDLDGDGNMDYFTDYSEDLELEPGTYILEQFIVYDVDGNVIWVAPIDEDGSGEYDGYVDNALPLSIDLKAGVKKYVDVEVLCFDDREANQYGYLFFDLIPKKLHELCFFVNYCTDNGRHYTANYSLDLWYVNDDEDDDSNQIIDGNMPVTGMNGEDYFASPLCVAVPEPLYGEAADDEYLYYELTLEDWEGNYGDVADGTTISGYLTWDEVQALLDKDGDDDTVDYLHLSFNCGDDDDNGDGDGEDECNIEDPNADCDSDGIPNGKDNCPDIANEDQADLDEDGIGDVCDPDIDGDGIPNDVDKCAETPLGAMVGEDGCEIDETPTCEFTETAECPDYYLNGRNNEPVVVDLPAFFLADEGDEFDDRVATVTVDWSEGEIFYIINMTEGFTLQDYQIKIYSDASLANEICNSESGLNATGEGEPAAEGSFTNVSAFSDVFYAEIIANVCETLE